MRVRFTICLSCAGAALAGVALMVACHTESTTENNVIVTPASVRLAKGESQQFTASGGYEYTWSLDGGGTVDEWGRLSASRGPTTVYTSTKDASTAGTFRVVHVTSTIPGSGGTPSTDTNAPTTTTTSYSMAAEAYVEHAVKYESLNVSPAAVSGFKYGSSQTFTASGGNSTYSWNLQDDTLGEISTTVGPNTTYSSTSRALDDNTVNRLRCLSGDGQAVNVIIYHANELVTNPVTALSVTPSSANVTLDGSATFTASGGDGTYVWNFVPRGYGEITYSSQNTATYLCTNITTNVVIVTLTVRSNGETREATILHSDNSAGPLKIKPTLVTPSTSTNTVATVFTASGGVPPYSWDYTPKEYGTLVKNADEATYGYISYGTVLTNIVITVTDDIGTSAGAQVIQRVTPTP